MKNIYTILIALLLCFSAFSQTPSTFNYQAAIRDASGVILANESVKLTVKILPKTGSEVYSEIHEVQTNQYGLVNLEIGSKNTTKFSQINWSQGGFKLAVELGNVLIGTNDILTVPYAIHAKTAESLTNPPSESDPDYNTSHAANITENDITNLSNLSGTNSGDQDLTPYVTKEYLTRLEEEIFELRLLAGLDLIDSRDGLQYKTVKIGNQIWMAENLKYLPSVVDYATTSNTVRYYYVYGYNGTDTAAAKATTNYSTYGVQYNWPAAMNLESSTNAKPSGVQGVCPTGWHLPSDPEWSQLVNYLGGYLNAGGKLKETGTTHWATPNTGATNESGFTALPTNAAGKYGSWWTTTQDSDYPDYYFWEIGNNTTEVDDDTAGGAARLSVRCVKD